MPELTPQERLQPALLDRERLDERLDLQRGGQDAGLEVEDGLPHPPFQLDDVQ